MSLTSEAAALLLNVEQTIADTMNTAFVDGLHDEIERSVIANVYTKYYPFPANNGPWVYKRRGFDGIMKEDYNILSKDATPGDLEIIMENVAPGNPSFEPTDGAGAPADAVENDGPWNYELHPDPGPRPFMQPAAEQYVDSGRAEAALQAALNRM